MSVSAIDPVKRAAMSGRVVKLADLSPADVTAWSELGARAAMPNPLFEPSCLLAARHLVNHEQIYLVIAESGSTMYGCFPFQILDRWGAFRRPVMATQVRRMQYDGTPLLDRERPVEAAVALLSALRENSSYLPGLLINDWVSEEGPVAGAMEQAARTLGAPAYRYREWVRPVIRRRPDGDYRSELSFNTKRHIRRSQRRMTEDFGAAVYAQDCTYEPGVIDRIIELEGAGYKGEQGIALAQHPGEPQWFAEMCNRFREEGRLHVLGLRANERQIALQLMLRGGDGLFGLKLVYDEEFSKHGLGIPLIYDVIDSMFSSTDAAWLDTCTYPDNENLLRLYPDRRPVVALAIPVGGMLDRRVVDAVRVARSAKYRWASRNVPA